MIKRISIRSYRHANPLYSPLDLVVCEGETEVDYLSELARSLRIRVHIIKGEGTDPRSIINTAKTKSIGMNMIGYIVFSTVTMISLLF
ncbi:RloB domain-containing protein [Parachlamydia acanthamoebae]|uniref:RloB domain-containing protein n=1 Tax=Parachlamydia acanthamoebae TaxID=83552 RepID=UPI00075141AA|nr:RloB domain-containing protein [Parachlamydia acanthamoebae]